MKKLIKNKIFLSFLILFVVLASCAFLYFKAGIYFPKEIKTFVVHDNGAISLTVGVAESQKIISKLKFTMAKEN